MPIRILSALAALGCGTLLTLSSVAVAAPRPARKTVAGRASRPLASRGNLKAPTRAAGEPRKATASMGGSDQGLSAGARSRKRSSVEKAALEISDLKCGDHVVAVRRALQEIDGVKTAVIDQRTGLAVVDYDPARTELAAFLAACREAGFPAVEYHVENRFPKPIKIKGG